MLRPSVPILLLAATAPAAELVVRDLGLAVRTVPTGFAYEISDAAGRRSGDDAFDDGLAIAVGGAYSFVGPGRSHGPVAAAELEGAQYAYGSGGMDSYGVGFDGGWGWAIADRWQVLLIGRLSAGIAAIDLPATSTFPSFSADGIYVGYGAAATVDYALGERWLVGVSAGWQQRSHTLSASSDDIDLTLDTDGLSVGLELKWRVAVNPWRLE